MPVNKIIGCIMVIASCTSIGLYFSTEVKDRLEHLKEFRKLVVLLRGDIRYGNTPLPEAIQTITRRHEGVYVSFLNKVSEKLSELVGETFSSVWKEAVETELKVTSLNHKDKRHLIQFGENLGYLDKDMQMNTLDLYLSQLEEEIEELTKTVKDKTHLYNSLGVMAGIFISIVMI